MRVHSPKPPFYETALLSPNDENVPREFGGGGGERTAERALQNQFWRPQKLGLVWSVPLPFKRNDRESPKRGEGAKRIVGGGGFQRRFLDRGL